MSEEDLSEEEKIIRGLTVLMIPPFAVWSGFVLQKLWLWFAVPLGLPVILLAQAIGIGLLVSFATHRVLPTPKPSHIFADEIVTPGLFLFVGWVVRHFL